MKRSEMINILANEFIDRGMCGEPMAPIAADQILSILEIKGMQPPPIEKMSNVWFRSTGDYGYSANEWEPEDERD